MTKKVMRKGLSLGELPTHKDSSALCKSRFGFADVKALHDCRSSMKRPKKDQVTPERLMQFGFAYAPPLIIGAAVSNKVFDSLAGGAKTVAQLSKETGAPARGLRAIMNALVGLELLKKDRRERYSLTPESTAFLLSDKPSTQAGFFGTILPQLISRWLRLTDVVRDGQPAVAVNQETEGTEFFSQLVENIIPMSYPSAQALGDHLKVSKAKNDIRILDLASSLRTLLKPASSSQVLISLKLKVLPFSVFTSICTANISEGNGSVRSSFTSHSAMAIVPPDFRARKVFLSNWRLRSSPSLCKM